MPSSTLPPAIFLMGPTASGKTAAAVELAQQMPVELISVDSALVYRDMNIGTAKPDAATLKQAPHHLIDIIDPTEAYSAAQFRTDALHLMGEATARGRIPLLVGGTMLYFNALQHGLSQLPQADPELREELIARAEKIGWPAMHEELHRIDPETAARLQPNDAQRIERALEVFLITRRTMSALLREDKTDSFPYRLLKIALLPSDRTVLHQRIAQRFDLMLEEGLITEVKALRESYDLNPNMPSMRCVGYRQAWEYLEGEISHAELREKGIAATRQLAKRQMTWLRGMQDTQHMDCLSSDHANCLIHNIRQFVQW